MKIWDSVVVAASGPSLTSAVAERVRQDEGKVLVVNDAWRLLPFANALYACDARWWDFNQGVPQFQGEKWSSHDPNLNEKRATAEKYGLQLIPGADAQGTGFSYANHLHYGGNSGFQAVNLAILWGATHIILVGFDMRSVAGRRHFFGDHPPEWDQHDSYESFRVEFIHSLPLRSGLRIVNATPGSALTCFPMMELDDAFRDRDLHCNRTQLNAVPG